MKIFENRPAYDTPKKRRYMALRHALASHRVEYGDIGTQAYASELANLEREGVGLEVRESFKVIRGK